MTHEKEGKASFAHVYDEPDPRPYFRELGPLDYRTPAHAEPIFRRLIARPTRSVTRTVRGCWTRSGGPSPALADFTADVDLVTVTGGVGYIGAATLARILRAASSPPPWIAAFALRMVPYGPIAAALADHGLVTETLSATFPQRRFATPDERDYVLRELEEAGVGLAGEEAGHYLAVAHVSRPVGEADTPVDDLLSGTY